MGGCNGSDSAKKTSANEKKKDVGSAKDISGDDLLNRTKIVVEYKSFVGDTDDQWTIVYKGEEEVAYMNALQELPGGKSAFKAWMGDDDLSVLWNALGEGRDLGVDLSIKNLVDSPAMKVDKYKRAMAALHTAKELRKADGTVKRTLTAWSDTQNFFFRSDDASSETMKILSYAIFSEAAKEMKFGHWKYVLLPYSADGFDDIERYVYLDENGRMLAEDDDKSIFFKRRGNSMILRNGVELAQVAEGSPTVHTNNSQKEGKDVQQNLRNLIYDIYLTLEGKDPIVYPEYTRALVKNYQEELKAFEEKEGKEKADLFNELSAHIEDMIDLAENANQGEKKAGTDKLISQNDREFHTIGGAEDGPYGTSEYKQQLQRLIDEGKVLFIKTVDLEKGVYETRAKMDLLQLKDTILGIQYNDACSCFYETYDTIEEAEKDAMKVDETVSEKEASKLIEGFYENIINKNYKAAYQAVGLPWRNKMSYESFSSGYANSKEINFWITDVKTESDMKKTVKGTVQSVDEKDSVLTKNTFNVEYNVERQGGETLITSATGTKIDSFTMSSEEDEWSFEQWERASFEDKVIKVARTWERYVYSNAGAAKADYILASAVLYLDDNYESLKNESKSVAELIVGAYDHPDLSNYSPDEKCNEGVKEACGYS